MEILPVSDDFHIGAMVFGVLMAECRLCKEGAISKSTLITRTGILAIRAWVLWDISRKWRTHFIALSATGILLVILCEVIYLRSMTFSEEEKKTRRARSEVIIAAVGAKPLVSAEEEGAVSEGESEREGAC